MPWRPTPAAPAQRRRLLDAAPLRRLTPKTVTDVERLELELKRIRRDGYAIDDEERAEGMRCVAAAIFNAYGEPVAGLSVSGPAFRLTRERATEIGALVRRAAEEVTTATGGRLP